MFIGGDPSSKGGGSFLVSLHKPSDTNALGIALNGSLIPFGIVPAWESLANG